MTYHPIISITAIEMMYGVSFSLCTLITLESLFYRKIKRSILFPVAWGAVYTAEALIMQRYLGVVFIQPTYLVHTAAAFLLLCAKTKDMFISLVFSELFSAGMISSITLCTVLSDLLDNAIEAVSALDSDRKVTLSAKRSGAFYYIRISNPTAHAVAVSDDMPTSKHDIAGHGLGLKSVRKAVEKCGGTLELSCSGTPSGYEFTAEVILPEKVVT